MSVLQELRRAREAYERREWVTAYQALSGLEDSGLAADDFVALATSAYMAGRGNDIVQALQRAYRAYAAEGNTSAAARTAYWLTVTLWNMGEVAIGGGWLARGLRLLDSTGEDVVERGYLLERTAYGHVMRGELDDALVLAPQIVEYGERFSDPDLSTLGLHMQGRIAIYAGRVAEGVNLLDEAMVAVIAGEISPTFSGMIYCSSIEACQEVSDLGRAAEWTQALTQWCDSQPGLVAFTGQCAVHRGQLMRLHGAYADAITELDQAARRYEQSGGDPGSGLAHYERAEVLRTRGEHEAASAAYDAAADHGHSAQPGRALLWSESGRATAAAAAIRRLLAEWGDPVSRSRLLPAAIDILTTGEHAVEAQPLAEELADIAGGFDSEALKAAAGFATAQVSLAIGDPASALAPVRRAAEAWGALDAPFEVARCRMLLGRALRMLGDEESAVPELTAARATFARLGTLTAERQAAALLGDVDAPGGLSPREVEVLRLVAVGKSNTEIAEELVLADKTVARHLSNIFAKLDVRSRTAAAAFAYEHHLL